MGPNGVYGRMSALNLRPRPVGAIAFIAAEHCCVEAVTVFLVNHGVPREEPGA